MGDREMLNAIKALLAQQKREIAGETVNNMHRFKQEIVMGLSGHTEELLETHTAQKPDPLPEHSRKTEEKPTHHSCAHLLGKEVQELKDLATQINEELSRLRWEPEIRPRQRRSGGLQVALKRQKKINTMMAQLAALQRPSHGQPMCARCKSCGSATPVRPVARPKR